MADVQPSQEHDRVGIAGYYADEGHCPEMVKTGN
jgi:hypothetical protein